MLRVSTSHALVCRRCGSHTPLVVSNELDRVIAACASASEPAGHDLQVGQVGRVDEVRLELAGICAACSAEPAGWSKLSG